MTLKERANLERANILAKRIVSGDLTGVPTIRAAIRSQLEEVKRETREAGAWISVKERKPENGQDVLAYNGSVCRGVFWEQHNDFQWWPRLHEPTGFIGMVTHWRPLLEPPLSQKE